MTFSSRLACGEDVLTIVQYIAWIDLLLYFVLIGPMILVFLATNGVNPFFREPYTILSTLVNSKGENTVVAMNLTVALYEAERGMTEIEFKIATTVRDGCGSTYLRDFPDIWDTGQPHLITAALAFCSALTITLISAILFLFVVPSKGYFGKHVPSAHFISQFISVGLTMIGCWQFSNSDLCFLEYVWPSFRLQTGIIIISVLVCLSYKAWEIILINAFVKVHLKSVREQEALVVSPSQEILNIMNSIKSKKDEKSAPPAAMNFTWEADSDIKNILAGFQTRVDLPGDDSHSQDQQSSSATTNTTNFFDSSAFSFGRASISTAGPSAVSSGLSAIQFNPVRLSVTYENHDLHKDDGMTVLLPAIPNFKFDDHFKF